MMYIPKVEIAAAMRAPIGGVKNDHIICDVVLFLRSSGIFENAFPASQKEQTRRYREMNA